MSWLHRCRCGRTSTLRACALWPRARAPAQTRRSLALSAIYAGNSRSAAAALGGVGLLEVWFADEAWVDQKNTISRRWAERGTCPAAPKDQRTASAHIFGAICPVRGTGAGLVVPRCTLGAMALHLDEIAQAVAPGAHAILLSIKPAGTRPGSSLCPPTSPCCRCRPAPPELNPVENLWQFMRDTWLGNRVFTPYADILDHCCDAWNTLIDRPWRIMSIGLRAWSHGCRSVKIGITDEFMSTSVIKIRAGIPGTERNSVVLNACLRWERRGLADRIGSGLRSTLRWRWPSDR